MKGLIKKLMIGTAAFAVLSGSVFARYAGLQQNGSIAILTTPDGANLPASATEREFPVLVRLHKDFFDSSQAKAAGEDLRFSVEGKPLAYQIDDWNPATGTASIWVRMPSSRVVSPGNAPPGYPRRQMVREDRLNLDDRSSGSNF
jgi:hypothetical protein